MNTQHSHAASAPSRNAGWKTPRLFKLGDVVNMTASGSAPGFESIRRGMQGCVVVDEDRTSMC